MVSFFIFAHLMCAFLFVAPISSFVKPRATTRCTGAFKLNVHQEKEEYSVIEQETKPKKEYAALSPGCTVKIQVGDVSLARKAWKKRRRTGSPLLVPCSILSVDRKAMVRWNILYLLQKFGVSVDELEQVGFAGNDIALSMSQINKYYQKHLGASLSRHAKALGHETARSLVRELFNKNAQRDIGVRLWLPPLTKEEEEDGQDNRPMYLMAPLSRQRAHRMASKAGLLQFVSPLDEEDAMQHTGMLRIRDDSKKRGPPHSFLNLSAALRISQRMVDQGVIREGSIHSAVVFSLDLAGDGGSPLMTLSLNPTRGQVRDRLKLKAAGRRHFSRDRQIQTVGDLEYNLLDLKVGDGPFLGKVTHLSTRSQAAFVDCGVGRNMSSKGGTRVLGMLRFDDLVKSTLANDEASSEGMLEDRSTMSNEEEEFIENTLHDVDDEDDLDDEEDVAVNHFGDLAEDEEDITHLFSMEDGEISYQDEDTGERTVLSSDIDYDDDDEDDDDDDEILFKNMTPEERLDMISQIMEDQEDDGSDVEEEETTANDSFQPAFVKVGDDVEVYIKSVYKQSGRFMVTLEHPSGRKAKDLKKEAQAEKKLARMVEKLGGYERIHQLEGTECDGVVQALSQTGDWCYVKPSMDDVPVGVATLEADAEVSQGDAVRVRIDGIDESRGQLAMTVIDL